MHLGRIENCLAAGLGFTEGPLWTSRKTLMAVALSRGLVHELDPNTGSSLGQLVVGGHPNGLAQSATGDIWVAQAGHDATPASIQQIRGHEFTTFEGPFDAPNDLAFGPDGLLWFTDPCGNPMDNSLEKGRIWTLDTSNGQLSLKTSDVYYPNGLAFSPHGDALYVAETATGRVIRYSIAGEELRSPDVFVELPSGRPDGMAFDASGALYVAGTQSGIVYVVDVCGRPVEALYLPEGGFPTNLCFGGNDLKTLFVTSPAGGRIYSVARETAGLPLGRRAQ